MASQSFGLATDAEPAASTEVSCGQTVTISDEAASLDFEIVNCGTDLGNIAPGEELTFNMEVQNNVTSDTGGIIGDAVWLLDGQEAARVEDHEIGPDRSAWASTTVVPGIEGEGMALRARFENVRFINQ